MRLPIFNEGVLQGAILPERLKSMTQLGGSLNSSDISEKITKISDSLNSSLRQIVSEIRKKFNGKITYSSGAWESVEWGLFDVVGVDYYRNGRPLKSTLMGLGNTA